MQDIEQCIFDLSDLNEYIDLSSFRFMLVAITGTKIAIATSRYLVIMEEIPITINNNEKDKIQTVVEFGEISGRPTAIQWLNDNVLCIGFETGALTCFNDFGETISEQEFCNSPLMAIHVLPSIDPTTNTQHIWALFENGFLISVPINHLLGGTSLARYYLKYKLVDHGMVNDFTVLSSPYLSSLFDTDSNNTLTSFIVSGIEPALSLYTVGGKQQFQHFGKLASYVRDKVHSAISKTVGSALISFFGSGSNNEQVEEGEDFTPITSVLDFNESEKRRILRLSLSPGGKLIAAADSLGRVLLFDSRLATTVVRVWKGVREARFAWTEDRQPNINHESNVNLKPKKILSLAIYAPQTGLLSLWALRHGPCLRSIPVGQQCHVFTVFDFVSTEKEIQSRCALLRPGNENKLHFSIVSPFGYSDEDIDLSTIQENDRNNGNDNLSNEVHETSQILNNSTLSSSTTTSASSQSLVGLDEMKIYETIEKAIKVTSQKKNITSNDFQQLEHRIWMNLSGLKDIKVILKSVALVEDYEIEQYNKYYHSNSNSNNNSNESSHLFSLQFHRNICRLLDDVINENKGGILNLDYKKYAFYRNNFVKAYEMFLDINLQISLASAAPPGTESNKWGKQNNARAEAICWAARRLAPSASSSSSMQSHLQSPFNQRLMNNSINSSSTQSISVNSSSPTMSMLMRSSSFRSNSLGPNDFLDTPAINSNTSALTSLIQLKGQLIIEKIKSINSNLTSNSSINSTPSANQTILSSSPSTSLSILTNNQSHIQRNLSLSVFLLLNNCSASSVLRKSNSNEVIDYIFNFDEFTILLDIGEGNIPPLNNTNNNNTNNNTTITSNNSVELDNHLDNNQGLGNYSILNSLHPKLGREVLSFIYLSLLGDVFTLQKFLTSIDIIGLGGGISLRKSLPMMMSFMEAQSMSVVFNALVNKQLSASPLQRWIRDTLLSFQSFLSGVDDTEEGNEGVLEEEHLQHNKEELRNLLSDVIQSRQKKEYNNIGELQEKVLNSNLEIPTIDEVIRYLLRPAWIQARKSLHLECTMIIAAQILEVLEAVSDQLERRTFGEVNLNGTKLAWETLIRQLRVVMLLSSRAGGMLSVERLGSGTISIYSLLAADTLCFAMQADQAAEHELRCQDVYTRRALRPGNEGGTDIKNQGSNTIQQEGENQLGALLAWGPSADSRWRELVTVAEAEDAFLQEATSGTTGGSSSPRPSNSSTSNKSSSSKSKSSGSKKIRRRRPLLLFFPTHNQPGPLGAYRGLALADRWSRRPKRVEILSLAGAHLLPIPPITRAAVAERILLTVVFPLLRSYLDVEEGKIQKVNATDPVQELLVVMADSDLVESFVQSTIELISFCLQGGVIPTKSPVKISENNSQTFSSSLLNSSTSTSTLLSLSSNNNNTNNTNNSNSNNNNNNNEFDSSYFEDELNPAVWPPANDGKLTNMIKVFQNHSGIGDVAARWHMGLLWVLQLRTQCSLRGVKISELFGSKLLKIMCQSDSLSLNWPLLDTDCNRNQTFSFTSEEDTHSELEASYHIPNNNNNNTSYNGNGSITSTRSPSITSSLSDELHSSTISQSTNVMTLKAVREEFLLQCFRRLAAQSSNLVYSIAEIWDIDNTQARLVHLTTLLELGQDDIISELINHFEDSLTTADRITQGLRVRIGNSIVCIERIPACGPLLSSLDSQAVAWVREAAGTPDRSIIDGIMKGKIKVINFDVPSTRHLVIRIQALLFAVPINNRDEKWMERKTKCDALLQLCSSLSNQEVLTYLKGSGLLL